MVYPTILPPLSDSLDPRGQRQYLEIQTKAFQSINSNLILPLHCQVRLPDHRVDESGDDPCTVEVQKQRETQNRDCRDLQLKERSYASLLSPHFSPFLIWGFAYPLQASWFPNPKAPVMPHYPFDRRKTVVLKSIYIDLWHRCLDLYPFGRRY